MAQPVCPYGPPDDYASRCQAGARSSSDSPVGCRRVSLARPPRRRAASRTPPHLSVARCLARAQILAGAPTCRQIDSRGLRHDCNPAAAGLAAAPDVPPPPRAAVCRLRPLARGPGRCLRPQTSTADPAAIHLCAPEGVERELPNSSATPQSSSSPAVHPRPSSSGPAASPRFFQSVH